MRNSIVSTWGGEALYKSPNAVGLRDRFRELGSPAVVVARLDCGLNAPNFYTAPSLVVAFARASRWRNDGRADVHYRAHIPPEQIETIEDVTF